MILIKICMILRNEYLTPFRRPPGRSERLPGGPRAVGPGVRPPEALPRPVPGRGRAAHRRAHDVQGVQRGGQQAMHGVLGAGMGEICFGLTKDCFNI